MNTWKLVKFLGGSWTSRGVIAAAVQEADRATAAIKQSVANLAEARLRQAPPKPAAACEDEAAAAAAQSAAAMFFQQPDQLEEILADLEEQNLFLIQNTQEAEEALDAVEAKYKCATLRQLVFFHLARSHLACRSKGPAYWAVGLDSLLLDCCVHPEPHVFLSFAFRWYCLQVVWKQGTASICACRLALGLLQALTDTGTVSAAPDLVACIFLEK